MILSFITGVVPLYWVSDDGRYFLVPPGPAVYMKYKTFIDFAVHGEITDAWLEFDISRLPLKYCCEYINDQNVFIRLSYMRYIFLTLSVCAHLIAVDADLIRWRLNNAIKKGVVSSLEDDDEEPVERKKRLRVSVPANGGAGKKKILMTLSKKLLSKFDKELAINNKINMKNICTTSKLSRRFENM